MLHRRNGFAKVSKNLIKYRLNYIELLK